MEEMGNAYTVLIEKSIGKRLVGRPGRGWEDNRPI
jgi:hypothetical protein